MRVNLGPATHWQLPIWPAGEIESQMARRSNQGRRDSERPQQALTNVHDDARSSSVQRSRGRCWHWAEALQRFPGPLCRLLRPSHD